MIQIQCKKNIFVTGTFLVLVLTLVSCKKDKPECSYDGDCNVALGEFCRSNKCRTHNENETDSETETSTDKDTQSNFTPDTSSNSDIATPTDSDITTPTDSTVETDSTVSTDSNSTPQCVSNSQCDDGNPCTADYCNTALSPSQCDVKLKMDGLPCGENDPCMGKGTCQNGECEVANPPCTPPAIDDECVQYEVSCDPERLPMCTYTKVPANENEICFNDNPCAQGVCSGGECVDEKKPCEGITNSCTAIACEVTGTGIDDYRCDYSLAPNGQTCMLYASDSPCYSSDATPDYVLGYCMGNGTTADCIVAEDRRCFDNQIPNICEAFVCVAEDASCVPVPPQDVSIHVSCDETLVLTPEDFLTRDYYEYSGGTCAIVDARGKELAIQVDIDEATDVSFEVVDSGDDTVSLLHLSDMCDPHSCLSNAVNKLSVSSMEPTDAILVEAAKGYPASQIQLRVTCSTNNG